MTKQCALHDSSKSCTNLCSRLTVERWPELTKGSLKDAVKENPFKEGSQLWEEWEKEFVKT